MTYSVSSVRYIDEFNQRISVMFEGTSKATSVALYNTLKTWITPFETLDATGRNVGFADYTDYQEWYDDKTGNTGSKGDVSFIVRTETSLGNPNILHAQVLNTTPSTIASDISATVTRLLGYSVTSNNVYIVSANIELHD